MKSEKVIPSASALSSAARFKVLSHFTLILVSFFIWYYICCTSQYKCLSSYESKVLQKIYKIKNYETYFNKPTHNGANQKRGISSFKR